MKFKKKKRCQYCAHVLGKDGLCYNDDCPIGKKLRLRALEEKEKEKKEGKP